MLPGEAAHGNISGREAASGPRLVQDPLQCCRACQACNLWIAQVVMSNPGTEKDLGSIPVKKDPRSRTGKEPALLRAVV